MLECIERASDADVSVIVNCSCAFLFIIIIPSHNVFISFLALRILIFGGL